MMRNLMIILKGLMLATSCENRKDATENDFYPGKPVIPVNDSVDMNSDQVIDFVISYRESATYDYPSSHGSITGSINPIHQNRLLHRNNAGYLFLRINDTIRKVSNTHSDWNAYDADVIIINRDHENWDRAWTVLSEQKNYYFLAYKLLMTDAEKIGWVSLSFDTISGEISITDGDYSNNPELIIHKNTTD